MDVYSQVLIAGFGSMGRWHLCNLRSLGHHNLRLYRTSKNTLPNGELTGLPVEYDLDKALSHQPVAAVISNPTSMHMAVDGARTVW
jgi:hypothetical protein